MVNTTILFVENLTFFVFQICFPLQDKPMYRDQYRFSLDCQQQLL
jgi:hypothetical protein